MIMITVKKRANGKAASRPYLPPWRWRLEGTRGDEQGGFDVDSDVEAGQVGVALESADFGVITSRNVAYWGIWLADREMEFAGKKMKRTRGPDAFSVPCMVTVRLDCDEGTMAVVAGEVDLGVVCDALPKRQGLRLAVATTSRKCRVVQEGYARLA